jgi:hypothetical protein
LKVVLQLNYSEAKNTTLHFLQVANYIHYLGLQNVVDKLHISVQLPTLLATGNGLSYLRVPGWFSLSILKISKTKLENQNRKITSTAMAKRGMNQRLFLSISTLITLKIPNWMHQLWKLVSYGAKYYSKYQICSSVLVVSL